MTSKTISSDQLVPIICGPTASGKTSLSIEIAKKIGGEIISADSRQFYREMSIGTAKPTSAEMQSIPHHFIDSHSIAEPITAGQFAAQAEVVMNDILKRGHIPIIVGGSGLYINALVYGFDVRPSSSGLRKELNRLFDQEGVDGLRRRLDSVDLNARKFIDDNNPMRLIRAIELVETEGKAFSEIISDNQPDPKFNALFIGIDWDREKLYGRIDERVDQMIDDGLETEVKELLKFKESPVFRTVGYQEFIPYFNGDYDIHECIRLIKRNSRRYAKRQLTWFRRNPSMNWFRRESLEEAIHFVHNEVV